MEARNSKTNNLLFECDDNIDINIVIERIERTLGAKHTNTKSDGVLIFTYGSGKETTETEIEISCDSK